MGRQMAMTDSVGGKVLKSTPLFVELFPFDKYKYTFFFLEHNSKTQIFLQNPVFDVYFEFFLFGYFGV